MDKRSGRNPVLDRLHLQRGSHCLYCVLRVHWRQRSGGQDCSHWDGTAGRWLQMMGRRRTLQRLRESQLERLGTERLEQLLRRRMGSLRPGLMMLRCVVRLQLCRQRLLGRKELRVRHLERLALLPSRRRLLLLLSRYRLCLFLRSYCHALLLLLMLMPVVVVVLLVLLVLLLCCCRHRHCRHRHCRCRRLRLLLLRGCRHGWLLLLLLPLLLLLLRRLRRLQRRWRRPWRALAYLVCHMAFAGCRLAMRHFNMERMPDGKVLRCNHLQDAMWRAHLEGPAAEAVLWHWHIDRHGSRHRGHGRQRRGNSHRRGRPRGCHRFHGHRQCCGHALQAPRLHRRWRCSDHSRCN